MLLVLGVKLAPLPLAWCEVHVALELDQVGYTLVLLKAWRWVLGICVLFRSGVRIDRTLDVDDFIVLLHEYVILGGQSSRQ